MALYVILKNTLLLALIILIVHFMVMNDLLENEYMHTKRLGEDENTRCRLPIEEEIPKPVINQPHFSSSKVQDINTNSSPDIDEYFNESTVDVSDIRMKELYDFVYDDTEATDVLNTLFDAKIETPDVQNTEIDTHHTIMKGNQVTSINAHLCDYEIVGELSGASDDPFSGIDMTCQTFSKTI